MKTIKIFDTTLRDGEQSPGATLNTQEKIQIALALEKMKVDVIEAGFAIASPDDFNAINKIARKVKNSTICSLSRAIPKDIEAAAQAVKPAKHPRIHTFISTSDIHLKYQMKTTQKAALEQAKKAVKLARKLCSDVEFSAMDASRTNIEYLCRVIKAVIQEGATTINIPDTVGYSIPEEFGKFIKQIIERIPEFKQNITLSVHCHNDLGLATANSLSAIQNGATQVECAINGLGERGGNTALEEVVMAIRTRKDFFKTKTSIRTKEISKISKLVANSTGIIVQPNKAIVGSNAFAHESGIHQDAILKKRETFEIMCAQDIGLEDNSLVLGKHSGRAALNDKLKKLDFNLNKNEILEVFQKFKELADKKKEIYDEDLVALVSDKLQTEGQKYNLELLQVICGNKARPTATISLQDDQGKIHETSQIADGPIDAIYRAIDEILGTETKLLEFSIKAITEGKDAQAEVITRIKKKNKTYSGYGASNDIIVASAKSYLNAINNSLK